MSSNTGIATDGEWKPTKDVVERFNQLATQSLYAVRRFTEMLQLEGTSDELPRELVRGYHSLLQGTTAEICLFPDDFTPTLRGDEDREFVEASDVIQSFREWYLHAEAHPYSILNDDDPSARRWCILHECFDWIELIQARPVNLMRWRFTSAHRAAIVGCRNLFFRWGTYVTKATDRPSDRPTLFDALISELSVDAVDAQREVVSMGLSREMIASSGLLDLPAAPATESPDDGLSHGVGFGWVMLNGHRFEFKAGNQAKVIELLVEDWRRGGSGIHQRIIGEKIDSSNSNFRLAHVFRNHSNWKELIVPVKGKPGTYRFAAPMVGAAESSTKSRRAAG